MASSRPPKKSKVPDLSERSDVPRFRIDDPTSAFPIGALGDVESIDDDPSPLPAASPAALPGTKEKSTPPPTPFRPVVAGVDLRWLVFSLAAGAVLAVFVVAAFGMVVLIVRS
jgi:hypothetical protein